MGLLIIYNEFAPNGTHCRYDIEVVFKQYKYMHGKVNEHKLDDDHFEKNQILFEKLAVTKETIETIKHVNSSFQNNFSSSSSCCEKIKLPFKRSLEKPKKKEEKRSQDYGFDTLPKLDTDNPIVMVLDICVRFPGLVEDDLDMAILEVSILSGYYPIIKDLEKYSKGPYIMQYVYSHPKITIYFRTVPNGRKFCFPFRLYQKNRVENMQSALIRMYNYYEQRNFRNA